jgi:hypothetical protein
VGNFDNTTDNRWRPDFESSRRRVHEEERDEVVQFSRELSFVPARRKEFEPHNPQTLALIRRITERVSELLEEWSVMDRMKAPEEKQRFLEPFIEAVQHDPQANEALLIFLMVAFEPVRRGVSRRFEMLRSGLTPQPRDLNWSNREEARRLREIDRQAIFDITREAALEAVFGYPTPGPPKFFQWLRGTIAHRALDALAGELPELETSGIVAARPTRCRMPSPDSRKSRALRCATAKAYGSGASGSICAMFSTSLGTSTPTTRSGRRARPRSSGCRGVSAT